MDAEDDRYAKLFLFTEEEVGFLCDAHQNHQVRNCECRNYFRRFSDSVVDGLVSSLISPRSDHITILIKQEAVLGLWPCSIPSPLPRRWSEIRFQTTGFTLVWQLG